MLIHLPADRRHILCRSQQRRPRVSSRHWLIHPAQQLTHHGPEFRPERSLRERGGGRERRGRGVRGGGGEGGEEGEQRKGKGWREMENEIFFINREPPHRAFRLAAELTFLGHFAAGRGGLGEGADITGAVTQPCFRHAHTNTSLQ